jgi:HlyD family secretion protein
MAHADARKRIPVVIVLLLVIGGLIWWFARPQEFRYAGTIEATEVDVSPAVSASIAAYSVKEGDAVKTGQVLVRLDGPDIRLNAQLAEADHHRGQQLLRDGSMTQAVFDKLKTQRDLTALQVSWLTLTAPKAGVILQTYHEPGEWVRPGVNLLTLGDLDVVWAYVYVEQPMLARLTVGQAVAGTLPEIPGRRFSGRVAFIRDQAEFTPKNVQTRNERTRLVYGVKIEFQNPDRVLKPGMTIEVQLPERQAP